MSDDFNWQCPFCGNHSTITSGRHSRGSHYFEHKNKYGGRAIHSFVVVCPNEACKEFSLTVVLAEAAWEGSWRDGKVLQTWRLIPSADSKVFPDYIPAPILADYREACLIRDLSPKAAATLARRCMQGIIRSFWSVSRERLVDEIEAIREMVDPLTFQAIDAVRNIGNIGAHMEQDINLVVEVEPGEANLLIGLIETLLTEWYVNRHERELRMNQLIAVAADKKEKKKLRASA